MEINFNSLINVLTSILRMYSLLYWPGIIVRKIYRSSDKRYARDNRLMNLESSYWWVCLAPRCRLIKSWWCTIYQGFGCSPIKVRELGLKRCKTVWSLSTVKKFKVILRVYSSTKGPKRANQWYFQLFLRVSW